jgi:hypothetical protein
MMMMVGYEENQRETTKFCRLRFFVGCQEHIDEDLDVAHLITCLISDWWTWIQKRLAVHRRLQTTTDSTGTYVQLLLDRSISSKTSVR